MKRGRQIGRYAVIFGLLIAAYLGFAFLSSLLPNRPIVHHAAKSIQRGDLQLDFGFLLLCRPEYYLDNFTDALILNQACSGGRDSLLTHILLVPRADGGGEMCQSLLRLTQDDPTLRTIHYGRYWHGSTFVMRFLLLMIDYVALRALFYILSTLLLLWVALLLYRRMGWMPSALFVLPLLLVNGFVMQFSIQLLPVLMIALGGVVWLLRHKASPSQFCLLLFVLGSLTAYFDLLTCPVLTWGLPMCVYLLLRASAHRVRPSLWRGVKEWFYASVLWAVGYGLTWVTKWGLATLLTGENVLHDGAAQFALRAGEYQDFSRLDALLRNADLIGWPYFLLVLVPLVAWTVWAAVRRNRSCGLAGVHTALLCLFTALAPCLWLMATAQHSYLHYWFTYRTLAVSLMALYFAPLSLLRPKPATP